MTRRARRTVLAGVVALGAGCGDSSLPAAPDVFSIELTPTAAVLVVDETVTLQAVALDGTGAAVTGVPIVWSSSDTTVFTVDAGGTITGRGRGTAVATARSEGVVGSAPVTVEEGWMVRSLSVGFEYACAIDLTRRAYCWGRNSSWQIGNDLSGLSDRPHLVSADLRFLEIAAGASHTCGITTDSVAVCWGDNSSGRLGLGTAAPRTPTPPTPVAAAGIKFAHVTVDREHTCAVPGDGAGMCWGYNGDGRLGTGTTTTTMEPAGVVGGFAFDTIAVGRDFTCGLDREGRASCWGGYGDDQLGFAVDSTCLATGCNRQPQAVSSGLRFSSIAPTRTGGTELVGPQSHACAVELGTGQAYCWGGNDYGQFGNLFDAGWTTPQPVAVGGGLRFSRLVSRGLRTCGVTVDGEAYCWGVIGGVARPPEPVAPQERFLTLDLGADFGCGITPRGLAMCWGNNQYGQLGRGSRADSPEPVRVVHPR